ncbi:septal ring lytic transglycosylase RlpA family protein [Paraburkholderia sp. D15]|uniref:septal ring lytic transglycosylase RlpA family protein n=1 Tax=Paraburkholderia sp. D15 TaxID=2880218 RepID=UPI002478BF47|nr:septal ring lytic transglycosylase RlpA family protein [Paraburkholderia sp. D15]WGS52108.1 septal ring lytic transglycosylase RlpA family protein [Paraburkholderia sp. D15]
MEANLHTRGSAGFGVGVGNDVSRLAAHLADVRSLRLRRTWLHVYVFAILGCWLNLLFAQQPASSVDTAHANHKAANNASLDRSGKARKGTASYYGKKFYSKKMADGTPMNPQSNVAASKTLPIGTTAKVTNLETGASAVVGIRDRGPYVQNRIVDVSPKTADKLGLKKDGTAPVEVKPVEVPQADGSVKQGAGAKEAGTQTSSGK